MKYIVVSILVCIVALAAACSPAPLSTPTFVPSPLPAPSLTPQEQPTNSPARPTATSRAQAASSSRTPTTASGTTPTSVFRATPSRTPRTTATPTLDPQATLAKVPAFSHIYLMILENKEYNKIVGDSDAPYLNILAAKYGVATNYSAIAHPSQPNYLALFSGSVQGVTDDNMYDLTGDHLVNQLEAKGKTWKIFAQNVPLNCYTGRSSDGGEDGNGTYARKHNPAISFKDISGSPSRCANITNFSHFDPMAADFMMILPNMCNVMHDCTVNEGDAFLETFIPRILASPAWQNDGVLFITFDEGNTNTGGGGHIPTLVISNRVQPGFQSSIAHNHYSLLRTIQDAWGLGCLASSCTANNLGEFFK